MLGVGALLAVLWWASPAAEPAFRACPFHWLTGKPCPLCGLTRGLCALAKGHWSQAIHFNTLTPLMVYLPFIVTTDYYSLYMLVGALYFLLLDR